MYLYGLSLIILLHSNPFNLMMDVGEMYVHFDMSLLLYSDDVVTDADADAADAVITTHASVSVAVYIIRHTIIFTASIIVVGPCLCPTSWL